VLGNSIPSQLFSNFQTEINAWNLIEHRGFGALQSHMCCSCDNDFLRLIRNYSQSMLFQIQAGLMTSCCGKFPTNVLHFPKPSASAKDLRNAWSKTCQPKHVNATFSLTALFATRPVDPTIHLPNCLPVLIPARKLSRQSLRLFYAESPECLDQPSRIGLLDFSDVGPTSSTSNP
jgi:hypothetical protein